MQREELEAIFDQQAVSYEKQWATLAPVRDALYFLIGIAFSDLPADARVLCVGAGTGAEMIYLAKRFPEWSFTVVEPSAQMLEVCRRGVEEHGIASRCVFHNGYLDSLPSSHAFDAATSLLVSQFILEQDARSNFFRTIAKRLRPGGSLASADLASDVGSITYQSLLKIWLRMMSAAAATPGTLERLRVTYERDVAVLPPERIGHIIASGGFDKPTLLFQGGLLHAWHANRAEDVA